MIQLKNKNVQMGIGVGLVVAILVGGYFFVFGKSSPKKAPVSESQDTIHTLSAKELGLTMELSPDKKKVRFVIKKPQGITAIEYQITYEADSTAQEQAEGGEPRVERGITGEAKIKAADSTYKSEWLDLGSCSRNICRYDTGLESLELTLKITKKDGKLYEATDTLDL